MLSRTAENYLRTIHEIAGRKGYVRVKDIAAALHVSAPTVTEMLEKLAGQHLVIYQKREAIALTEEGKRIATGINERYQVFLKLFQLAGVDPKIAYRDACALEHYISSETNRAIENLVERLERHGMVKI